MNYNTIISLVYQAQNLVFDEQLLSNKRTKSANDFVTAVDEGISDFLKQELYKLYPDIGFVTEEEQQHLYKERYFILDPIDGTTNLIRDYKASSISLALCENGEITFGIVLNPFLKELFFAIKGNGAYAFDTQNGINALLKTGVENYKEQPLQVSSSSIEASIIEFGAGSTKKQFATQNFACAQEIFCTCGDLRRICSTALSICYIAAGRIDGYFEKVIKPWDFAAASLILQEAGGKLSDFTGFPLPYDKTTTIVASNGLVHDTLLKIIQKHYGV